jgi:hypothetical protein
MSMETQQQLIETMPFFWGIAFSVNFVMGICLFLAIMRQSLPPWVTGVTTWVAWWAFATSISLLINVISGPGAPFSYHQFGILTETMMNAGMLVWTVVFVLQNWGVRGKDWERIEELRNRINNEHVRLGIGSEKGDDDAAK